jgi:Tfp pilus assembly protein PilF
LLAGEYKPVVALCTQELAGAGEKSSHRAETLLLRGTMYLLSGEGAKALADLDMLLNMDGVDKRVRDSHALYCKCLVKFCVYHRARH